MAVIGAPTTRAHFPDFAERNLRRYIMLDSNWFEDRAIYPKLYNVDTSEIEKEREAVVASIGTFELKPEGSPFTFDSGQEAWAKVYTHKEYGLGMEFTQTALEDDIHGVIKRLASAARTFAKHAAYTMERDAMDTWNTLLTSGTLYTAFGTAYSFAEAANPLVTGGSWANTPTDGAGNAISIDFNMENLEYAIAQWMSQQVDQRGLRAMYLPDTVLHGTSDWAIVRRVLGTKDRRPTTADNDINPVTSDFDLESICHPLLTNDGRWGMLATQSDEYGGRYYRRLKPMVFSLPDGDNGNVRKVCRYRESHGFMHVHGTWFSA